MKVIGNLSQTKCLQCKVYKKSDEIFPKYKTPNRNGWGLNGALQKSSTREELVIV